MVHNHAAKRPQRLHANRWLALALLGLAGSALASESSEQQQQSQLEQQLTALMVGAGNHQQQASQQLSQVEGAGSKSRSPRSIGDMFKKLFNANKRSKSAAAAAPNAREWDQLQQQQQQVAAFQNQMVASSLAAAAANQHAVYASPFAAYSGSPYSPYSAAGAAGLVAWPSSSLAQALGRPSLAGSAPVSLASNPASSAAAAAAGSLYAAASQPYTAYAAPPPGIAGPTGASQSQLMAAAGSHPHVSQVAPQQQSGSGAGPSSLDFHQVLDALVRTSGFAPAGDPQEAAAAAAYGPGKEGTPVFSFKKLVSLPFYLSTDEKSLDSLAPAPNPAGYALHSMPIMRRHVRRMSTPTHLQHHLQHQLQLANQLAAVQQQQPAYQQQVVGHQMVSAEPALGRSEREQQLRYSSYFNALNNQLASMTANNQLMSYLTRQQNQPSVASQVEAFAADAALAGFQAANPGAANPFKAAAAANPHSRASHQHQHQQQQQMAMAASTVVPMAVAAPQSLLGPPKEAGEREFQALLSSIQLQPTPQASLEAPYFAQDARFGGPQYYWPARESGAGSGSRDYLSLLSAPQQVNQQQPQQQQQQSQAMHHQSMQVQVQQNNAMLQQQQQQQQEQQSLASQSQQQQVVDQQQQQQQAAVSNSQQQQSAMNTQSQQQQQQQGSLVPSGASARDGTGPNSAAAAAAASVGFTQTSAQIEGQQK